MKRVRGVLLDIDGVLHVSIQPIKGAVETLTWLATEGYETCFVTNTTTVAHKTLCQQLQQIGLPIEEQHVMTAPVATANYIRQHFPGKSCWLLSKGDTASDFEGIELVDDHADLVVIGGAEEMVNYETMNKAFRMLMDGAELLAMHTNLYWRTKEGLQLDSGPFVRALEVASGKQATVLGKPNREFFEQALTIIGVEAKEAIMVGDDVENDIAGAQKAGIWGILVCTGKHDASTAQAKNIHPDAILPSIDDLREWLKSID